MTRMYGTPIRTRQRAAPQFRGDKFLRLTPEESELIAQVETTHGYDPYLQATTPVVAVSLTPPAPPARHNGGGGGFFWKHLLRRLAALLLEWAED